MSRTKAKKMSKKYTLVIEKDEDGWFVSEVVELPGCHTQAKTMNQLIDRTKEAIQAYLEMESHTQKPMNQNPSQLKQ